MDTSKYSLSERFTDLEIAKMFTVDCNPTIPHNQGSRMPHIEEPYVFNDVRVPLWTIRKRNPSRGERKALQTDDNIRSEVSTNPPGSKGRIEDLKAYYQGVTGTTQEGEHQSAFVC